MEDHIQIYDSAFILFAVYPASFILEIISSAVTLLSASTVRILSGLTVSTSQLFIEFKVFRKGVTVAIHPEHLILVLNFNVDILLVLVLDNQI